MEIEKLHRGFSCSTPTQTRGNNTKWHPRSGLYRAMLASKMSYRSDTKAEYQFRFLGGSVARMT